MAVPRRLRVRLTDPFWTAWQSALIERGLAHQWRMCEETGRLENFRRAARGEAAGHQGRYYDDSDVYKLMEAMAYAVEIDPASPVADLLEEGVRMVAAAQMSDGYLDTFFQLGRLDDRWRFEAAMHEMYVAGHLIEAGVAHARATGQAGLLDVGRRFADHIMARFSPDGQVNYPGHQGLEMALVRLAEATGDDRYCKYAAWLVESRGARPSPYQRQIADLAALRLDPDYKNRLERGGAYDGAYNQDDRPLREQDTPVGHAVRAMYLYCGAVDACGDEEMMAAMERVWRRLVDRRTYVTGGIGNSARNEGFTTDYDLPNRDAYAETCAAIGLIFWAERMTRATGQVEYADMLETALYNAALSGIGLDGDTYFYVNPLESEGDHRRQPWYSCACCPPNIARLILSLGEYVGYVDGAAVTVNLPLDGQFEVSFGDRTSLFRIESGWPWTGDVRIVHVGEAPIEATVRLRVPEWARGVEEAGYRERAGTWQPGDALEAHFPMNPVWLGSDPRIEGNRGRAALRRGPLVYCLEEADYGPGVDGFAARVAEPVREVPGGGGPRDQIRFRVTGDRLAIDSSSERLYGPFDGQNPRWEQAEATLIPYFAWANRAPGQMRVWLPAHGSAQSSGND